MTTPIRDRKEPRPDLPLHAVLHTPHRSLYSYEDGDEGGDRYIVFDQNGEEVLGPATRHEVGTVDVETLFREAGGDL